MGTRPGARGTGTWSRHQNKSRNHRETDADTDTGKGKLVDLQRLLQIDGEACAKQAKAWP